MSRIALAALSAFIVLSVLLVVVGCWCLDEHDAVVGVGLGAVDAFGVCVVVHWFVSFDVGTLPETAGVATIKREKIPCAFKPTKQGPRRQLHPDVQA